VWGSGFRFQGSRFGVQGVGCKVYRLRNLIRRRRKPAWGFRVQGAGLRVSGLGCRVQGLGFPVSGAGCRVQGLGFRV